MGLQAKFATKLTYMTLVYQFPLFDSVLRGNMSPYRPDNHASANYRLRLQEQITDPVQDEGLFAVSFLKIWHPKQEYYSRVLLSETFHYCNELCADLASETNRAIRAYYRETILDKHLTACLKQLGEFFIDRKLSLKLPEQQNDDKAQDDYINAWCMYLLRTCLVKAYLEIQETLTDVVSYGLSEEQIYTSYFNGIAPVKTYLKRREQPITRPYPEASAAPDSVHMPPENIQHRALPELLTPHEAAKILKVNVRTVTRMLNMGSLKGIKTNRLWRIQRSDLDNYIQNNPKKQTNYDK